MATITTNTISGLTEAAVIEKITLDGSNDALSFSSSYRNILILDNDTGGSLSPVLSGEDASNVTVQGLGVVDVSGGTDAFGAIADGESKAFMINTVSDYLASSVTITGGTGLVATLLVL